MDTRSCAVLFFESAGCLLAAASCAQAEICQCSSEHGTVQAITSATIPQNPAAVRLFEQLGFSHTHTVDMWPSYASLASYEQAVGFVPGALQQPALHTSLVDHVPGKVQCWSAFFALVIL
jgi:hypothetical protein